MDGIYFKKKNALEYLMRRSHKYNLGMFLFQRKSSLDMHYLWKMRRLNDVEHSKFYEYHESYHLEKDTSIDKKDYLLRIYNFVENSLKRELKKDPTKMNSFKKNDWERRKSKYKAFMRMLKNKDEWHIIKKEELTLNQIEKIFEDKNAVDLKEIISQYNEEIESINKDLLSKKNENENFLNKNKELVAEVKKQKKDIEDLKLELSKSRVLPQHKIKIRFDKKETVIDLFQQFIQLEHWDSKNLVTDDKIFFYSRSYNTWAKIISNNFTVGESDIPFDTVRKYFEKSRIGNNDFKRRYEIKLIN